MIENNIKFFVQGNGENVAIGLQGENVQDFFYMFYLYGATSRPEITMSSDNFGYFWTSVVRFERAVEQIMINRLINKGYGKVAKGKKSGFMNVAKKLKNRFMAKCIHESFISFNTVGAIFNLADSEETF